MASEEQRLIEAEDRTAHWKRWGPYLSEGAWGTVREDYSAHGTTWDYLPHDHARSKAYRWNEDGINRGPEVASLDVLPTVWFRNTWSWDRR
jgi:hypothetical protein